MGGEKLETAYVWNYVINRGREKAETGMGKPREGVFCFLFFKGERHEVIFESIWKWSKRKRLKMQESETIGEINMVSQKAEESRVQILDGQTHLLWM